VTVRRGHRESAWWRRWVAAKTVHLERRATSRLNAVQDSSVLPGPSAALWSSQLKPPAIQSDKP